MVPIHPLLFNERIDSMSSYHNFIDKLSKYIFYFLAIIGIILLAVGTAQVVSRYVLRNSLAWSEEIMRFLNIWTIYIGISVGIPLGMHAAIDAVPNLLKGKTKIGLELFIQLISLIFYIIVIIEGYKFSVVNLNQYAPATMIPMGYIYICLPFGGLLATLFTIDEILKIYERAGKKSC